MGCGETIGGSSRVGRSVDVANQVALPIGAWCYARAPQAARSEELADNILSSSSGTVPPVTRNELAMALSMLKKGSALGLDLLPSDILEVSADVFLLIPKSYRTASTESLPLFVGQMPIDYRVREISSLRLLKNSYQPFCPSSKSMIHK